MLLINKMRVFLLKDFISKSYDALCVFYITYIGSDKTDIALNWLFTLSVI